MPSRSRTRSQPAQKPAPSKRTNKRFLDDDDMIEDESDSHSDSYKENVQPKNTEPEDFDEEPKRKKKRPARTGSKSQPLKKTRKDKDSLECVANEDDQIPHTPQFERAKNICASVKRHLAKPLELAEEEGKLLSLSLIFILLLFLY